MPNRAFNHILNAVHLHSTMSMSISPMKRGSSTATFQTTSSSSPISKENWGHWMATSMHDLHLRIIHLQGPPHPECTCCHHFQHAFLLHPELVGGQCLRWW